MTASDLPDDWGAYWRQCWGCGETYHTSGVFECACEPCPQCDELIPPGGACPCDDVVEDDDDGGDAMTSLLSGLLNDRGADVSDCGRYRWRLWRRWNTNKPTMVFVMLNPSTADAYADDPTIRRCIGFARDASCGGITVVNLFPFRATDPKDLARASKSIDVEQRQIRDDWIVRTLAETNTAPVAAWGAHKMASRDVAASVLALSPRWMALGVTKSGCPRHPLYMPASARPSEWRPR